MIETLITRVDDQPREEFEWGWIAWLKSRALSPDATMTVGVCQINPGMSNPLHFHPNCEEVLLVRSGRCLKTIGEEQIEMAPGDCIRVPKGERHRARCISDEPLVCEIVYDSPDRKTVIVEK